MVLEYNKQNSVNKKQKSKKIPPSQNNEMPPYRGWDSPWLSTPVIEYIVSELKYIISVSA